MRGGNSIKGEVIGERVRYGKREQHQVCAGEEFG